MRLVGPALLVAGLWLSPALGQQPPAQKSEPQIWPQDVPFRPDPKLRCTAQGALMRCNFVPGGGPDDMQGLSYGIGAKQAGATVFLAFSLPLTLAAGKSIAGFEADLRFVLTLSGAAGVKITGELGGAALAVDGAGATGEQSVRVKSPRPLKGPYKGRYDVILRIELAHKNAADRAAVTLTALDVRALLE